MSVSKSPDSTGIPTARTVATSPAVVPVSRTPGRKLKGALLAGVAVAALYPVSQEGLRTLAGREPAAAPQSPGSRFTPQQAPGSGADEVRIATGPSAGARTGSLKTTRIERDGRSLEVVAGVALVRPRDAARARDRLEALGARVLYVSSSGFWRVSVPAGVGLETFLHRLEGGGVFSAVQPEGVIRAASLEDGQIAHADLQWDLDQMRWSDAYASGEVTLSELAGVTVAVVDSGLAYENRADEIHRYVPSTDLAWSHIEPGPDLVDGDSHPDDLNGHGTHLANIIAADGGTVGVAPHATLMPIRVLDAQNMGTELALVDAVNYAVDHGADIINLSLSFPLGYVPGEALAEALQHAADSDVFVAAASGNNGADEVSYPAAFADVLAVGASRLTSGAMSWVADYSNLGTGLDVVAPGGVGTLDVNRDGKPDGIVAQSIDPQDPSQLHYYLMSGTSQATAHVSGAAAWLRAAGADAAEIRQALINTSAGTWGARLFARRQGLGVVNLSRALNAWVKDSRAIDDDQQYYVDLMPLMYQDGDSVGAMGMIRVIDSHGLPAKKVLLAGHWFGSSASNFGVITNKYGEAFVTTTSTVPSSTGAGFGLQVDRVLDGRTRVAPAPVSFYYLTEGLLASLIAWHHDGRIDGADLLFTAEPGVHGLPSWVASSYVARPVGPVDSLVPTAITFNKAFIAGLAGMSSSSYVPVTATFPASFPFGWGRESSATVQIVDDVHFLNGDVRRLAFAPLDLGMFYGEQALSLPVMNSSSTSFESDTYGLVSGLDGGAVGAGALSTLAGDGALSTLAGEGALSTLAGEGVLSTLAGEGALVSLAGDGVLVSLAGEGALVSLAGEGALVSLAGDGAMSTLAGDGTVVEMLGSSATVPMMVASSYSDGSSTVPDPVEQASFQGGEDTIIVTPDE